MKALWAAAIAAILGMSVVGLAADDVPPSDFVHVTNQPSTGGSPSQAPIPVIIVPNPAAPGSSGAVGNGNNGVYNVGAAPATTVGIAGTNGGGVPVYPDGGLATHVVNDLPRCSGFHYLSAANTNATNVMPGPSRICDAIVITNTTATTAMDFRLIDSGGTTAPGGIPNCGSATGVVMNVPVPTNATAANVAGIVIPVGPGGLYFERGIAFCLTGGISDTDTSNAATGVQVSFGIRKEPPGK